ncbi:MAG: 23S rRNA (uracil(1939)-C(5))-methyltransferase RlmD [Aquificae bacterium]|nr:23S rRNA (uracil(1939)-C(5))-methyltransferase RlmD [Aquificota bacterium]
MKEKPLRVSVDKLVYGGLGLAKLNGKTLLIRFAAPKELVDVEVVKEKRDYLEGVVKRVVIPSSMRREAPCPYFGICGGCQIQHLGYSSQLEVKRETLLESLRRIGKIKEVNYLGDVPSRKEFNYRIRVQFKVQEEKLGFYAWNSKEVVDIKECLLAHEEINALIPHLREVMRAVPDLQEIHVSYSPKEDRLLLKLLTITHTDEKLLESIKENVLPPKVVGVGDYARVGSTVVKRYSLGREHLFMEVGKWKYRVSNDSFFQVNYTLWEDFVGEVLNFSGAYRKALDLHCGVGFFTIPLSEQGNFIEGADANPAAIKDAEYNARLNGRDNVIFREATAYNYLKKRAGEILDLVVLDPPRSGLLREEVDLLVKNKPERILYISCNPSTLARDLRMLLKGGYELEGVKLIDNFPQTYHVESIALLRVRE